MMGSFSALRGTRKPGDKVSRLCQKIFSSLKAGGKTGNGYNPSNILFSIFRNEHSFSRIHQVWNVSTNWNCDNLVHANVTNGIMLYQPALQPDTAPVLRYRTLSVDKERSLSMEISHLHHLSKIQHVEILGERTQSITSRIIELRWQEGTHQASKKKREYM